MGVLRAQQAFWGCQSVPLRRWVLAPFHREFWLVVPLRFSEWPLLFGAVAQIAYRFLWNARLPKSFLLTTFWTDSRINRMGQAQRPTCPDCGAYLVLALPPGGKGRRTFRCLDCERPDLLKDPYATGWLAGELGRTKSPDTEYGCLSWSLWVRIYFGSPPGLL